MTVSGESNRVVGDAKLEQDRAFAWAHWRRRLLSFADVPLNDADHPVGLHAGLVDLRDVSDPFLAQVRHQLGPGDLLSTMASGSIRSSSISVTGDASNTRSNLLQR